MQEVPPKRSSSLNSPPTNTTFLDLNLTAVPTVSLYQKVSCTYPFRFHSTISILVRFFDRYAEPLAFSMKLPKF
jgi:hypothetical protein